jgi:paraquat-inducible protein B
MADEPEVAPLPQAVVTRKKRLRISIIWIIPLLAALVAIGIAVQRLRAEGPTITIVLKEANGVEAGKTFIRYKDVRIGLVTAVELSEDYTKVLVKAKIAKHAAGLMVQDAQFWVVEPRISLSACPASIRCCRATTSASRPASPPSRRRCTSRWTSRRS